MTKLLFEEFAKRKKHEKVTKNNSMQIYSTLRIEQIS